MQMYQDEYIEEDIDIDKLVDSLIEAFKDMKPRYLPLSESLSCPHCRSIMKDEIDRPERDVVRYKCLNCSAKFYVDFR